MTLPPVLTFRLTKDPSRSARYDMLPIVQLPDILTNVRPSDTGMALHTHVVSNGQHYLWRQSMNNSNERVDFFFLWWLHLVTFCICTASSLVGERIRACVSLSWMSTFWRTEMEKVAVFPVPDWALQGDGVRAHQQWWASIRTKKILLCNHISSLHNRYDRPLLNRRRFFES